MYRVLLSEKFRTSGGTPIYSGEYFNVSEDDKSFINQVRARDRVRKLRGCVLLVVGLTRYGLMRFDG